MLKLVTNLQHLVSRAWYKPSKKTYHCTVRAHCMFRSQQGRGWLFGFRRPLPRCGWGILVSCFGTSLTIYPNADLKQRSLDISIRLAQHLLLRLRLCQVSHRSGTIRGGSRQASQRHCDATQYADLQMTSKSISLPAGSLIGAILYSHIVSIVLYHVGECITRHLDRG
jgi:hypothetical protein